MRTLFLSLLFGVFITSFGLEAQSSSIIISFGETTPYYHFEAGKTTCSFQLYGEENTIRLMQSKVENLGSGIELSYELSEETNNYNCDLSFPYEAGKENFHKILLYIGVDQFEINENLMPINELLNI